MRRELRRDEMRRALYRVLGHLSGRHPRFEMLDDSGDAGFQRLITVLSHDHVEPGIHTQHSHLGPGPLCAQNRDALQRTRHDAAFPAGGRLKLTFRRKDMSERPRMIALNQVFISRLFQPTTDVVGQQQRRLDAFDHARRRFQRRLSRQAAVRGDRLQKGRPFAQPVATLR